MYTEKVALLETNPSNLFLESLYFTVCLRACWGFLEVTIRYRQQLFTYGQLKFLSEEDCSCFTVSMGS